jgi:hypothetical protein
MASEDLPGPSSAQISAAVSPEKPARRHPADYVGWLASPPKSLEPDSPWRDSRPNFKSAVSDRFQSGLARADMRERSSDDEDEDDKQGGPRDTDRLPGPWLGFGEEEKRLRNNHYQLLMRSGRHKAVGQATGLHYLRVLSGQSGAEWHAQRHPKSTRYT